MHLHIRRDPAVAHAGAPVRSLARRDGALLAWLALEGPTSRARLAALFWPQASVGAARNALRQRLFQLKRQLGADLITGSEMLALADGVTHDLADASSLLGEDHASVSPEFDAWLQQQRAGMCLRTRQLLQQQCAALERTGQYAQALALTEQLLTLEPLSEEAHRSTMRLHYLAGDRAQALLAFDRCERMLKDEVGLAPSAETLALLGRVQGALTSAAATSAGERVLGAGSPPVSMLRPPRLIGRAREMAQLTQAWSIAHVVALTGEAGLGKSRMLQDFAASVGGIVHVAARPGDAGVPLALLARLLRAVIQLGPLRALEPCTRGVLARMVPEFDAALPESAGEGQGLVLQRAAASLLAAQPSLMGLLVDDLHFADDASLELLNELIVQPIVSNGAPSTMRWALAYRPAQTSSPLAAMHEALVEQARLLTLPLLPLDEAELAELVDSLALDGLDGRTLAPGLLQRTGGNPLFVLETLKQAWVESSLAQLADARDWPRPVSVSHLIERRLAQLSAPALGLARLASLAGVDFSVALAESVLGASAIQFVDAFNELEAAQVLHGNAFAHDLVFEAVQASVPAPIAEHTHAQLAAWLAQRSGEPARIARHWIAARQDALALPWLQQAADAAKRALRSKECVAFLEHKSAIEAALGQREVAFVSLLAAAEEAVNVDLDAATTSAHCERLDQLASTPAQRVEALLQRAHLHQQRGEFELAVQLARPALNDSLGLGDTSLTMRCRRTLSTACCMSDQFEEAASQLEACAAWFDEHGQDGPRSEIHGDLAVLYDNLGRLGEALPHHTLALELAQRSGNLSNASDICCNFACNRIDGGDLDTAERSLRQGQQLLGAYGESGSHVGTLQVLRTLCLCHLGRYAEAVALSEIAVESMRRYQPGHLNIALLRVATCWWHLGQWSRMARQLSEVTIDAQSSLSVRVLHARLRWLLCSAQGSSTITARLALEAELAAMAPLERPDLRLPLRVELAGTLEAQAALDQLEAVRREALALQHEGTVLASLVRAAGIAAEIDPGTAAQYALAGLALSARRQSTMLLPAEPWLHCARALHAAGDTAQAMQLLATGRDWLQHTARQHVPEPFRDSFLNRNPVNRELLALASRLGV
ncbi:MAG: AAA family ATPase [Rhodoferax sp.]|nr:AAA family ATPase [Rhodoferax sp.]